MSALALVVTLAVAASHGAIAGAEGRTVHVRIKDAKGDDFGAGGVSYPMDDVFHPHSGYFDLQEFEVSVQDGAVLFRFTMGVVDPGPFNPPEGFFHQRIDVYVHTGEQGGKTTLFREGAGVVFSPKHPWHLWLRVAPFGGTALYTWTDPPDSPGRQREIRVTASAKDRVIEVRIPSDILSPPRPNWRYYVLVGSFDGLGADEYRAVISDDTRWLLRGDGTRFPSVVDVIAPSWGPRRQSVQLAAGGEPPTVYPVGGFDPFRISPSIYLGIAALLVVFGVIVGRLFRPGS